LRVCIDGVGKRDVGGLKEIWFRDKGVTINIPRNDNTKKIIY